MITDITLDENTKATILGEVFGSYFSKLGDGYRVDTFLDFSNKRLKVIDFEGSNFGAMQTHLEFVSRENGLSKILLSIQEDFWDRRKLPDFEPEARIPTLFQGQPGILLSRFLTNDRFKSQNQQEEDQIIKLVQGVQVEEPPVFPGGYEVRICDYEDVEQLVTLYGAVFSTYPTPLYSEKYIRYIMARNVLFLGIFDNGKLISAASGEMNRELKAVEMTDCATLPEFRGNGFMQYLISLLEQEMQNREMITVFSLARAISVGMNTVFQKAGYQYHGRMVNNCHICGSFEDMNVWSKCLSEA